MSCGCSSCSGSCSDACSSCESAAAGCSTPAPYYNEAGNTQECHGVPVVQQILVAALSSGTDFIVPACGAYAVVIFHNLTSLQIGCYLWNATYGYFRVVAFNSLTGETKIVNDCIAANAAPGTTVPRCTLFTVTAPPWNACIECAGGDDYIFIFPDGPCPIPVGDPFSLDIVDITGNVITLDWHVVTINP